MKTRIALAQIHIVFGNPEANLAAAEAMILAASDSDATWIQLPELWSSGYDLTRLSAISEANTAILSHLQQVSTAQNIWISGSYAVAAGNSYANRYITLSPDNTDYPGYDKLHLFGLMKEDRHFSQGAAPIIQPLPFGKTGLSICYDLRFPELYRHYSAHSALLLANCAEWPAARVEHWRALSTARAIENQAWFAGVNAVGKTGKETFAGRSRVLTPWGEIAAEASPSEPELVVAEIDTAEADEIRRQYPFLQDRRM